MKIKFACLLVLFSSAFAVADSDSENIYVKIRQTKLKDQPFFLSKSKENLKFGDQLFVLKNEGEWINVKLISGSKGYVHSSAVSSKKIQLNSNLNPSSQVAKDGIVMAGKGFNEKIEREYALSHRNVDFKTIDRMESVKVSDNELRQFVTQGKLRER